MMKVTKSASGTITIEPEGEDNMTLFIAAIVEFVRATENLRKEQDEQK